MPMWRVALAGLLFVGIVTATSHGVCEDSYFTNQALCEAAECANGSPTSACGAGQCCRWYNDAGENDVGTSYDAPVNVLDTSEWKACVANPVGCTKLDLSFRGLTGTIPESIGDFTNLQVV